MPELTTVELERFFREGAVEPLRIEKLVETEDSRYLGAVGLSLHHPLFNSILGFNWSGVLSDSARFYIVDAPGAVDGMDVRVAVFRQFESSKYQAFPEDIIAGWVPLADVAQLERWVAEMNAHLARLLELKHARAEEQQKQ
jgi:hypothetical protein